MHIESSPVSFFFGLGRTAPVVLIALIALSLVGVAHAGTDRVATGEYAPLVSSTLPERGVTVAIVEAALQAQNMKAELEFLPWKRGYIETESGQYIGTFPYLKTAEREAAFFFSDEIYRDHFDIFVRAEAAKPVVWQGQSLCIPRGYDQTQIADFIQRNGIQVEAPSAIENCFQMLKAERVRGVWVSELVAASAMQAAFPIKGQVVSLKLNLVGDVGYYMIASRARPDAEKWVERFNGGLKKIRANGSYERIVSRSLKR